MIWGRVEVGADFLFVLALALYLDEQNIVPMAFISCSLHEIGHLIVLYLLGGRFTHLKLSAVGAEMSIEGHLSYWDELFIALGGPLANFVVAVGVGFFGGNAVFSGLNLILGLLNLIPVDRLDGGRICYAFCCALWGEEAGRKTGLGLNLVFCTVLLAAGGWILMMGGSFTLLFLSLWAIGGQKT